MASRILKIEERLNEVKNKGMVFGPNQLIINWVKQAHNGFTDNALVNHENTSKFYNGVRCAFDSFTVLFITHKGTIHYQPDVVQVVVEQYPKNGDEFVYSSPYDVLATVENLLNFMPGDEDEITYGTPKPSITLSRKQWREVESGGSGESSAKALIHLLDAVKLEYMLILTNDNGNNDGFLSFDQERKQLVIIP